VTEINNFSSTRNLSDPSEASNRFDNGHQQCRLHFSRDKDQFIKWFRKCGGFLKPRMFFARLASDIGIEEKVKRMKTAGIWASRGSERFLVDEKLLISVTDQLAEIGWSHLKTTNVQKTCACMTTGYYVIIEGCS